MKEPYWLNESECMALHDMMLSHYGGATGVRDAGLLASALARPQQAFAYGSPAMADLAAAYTADVVKNHPFVHGNKRIGFMLGVGFLERNGYSFTSSEADAALKTLALAAGEMTEVAYADWLESNSTKPKKRR